MGIVEAFAGDPQLAERANLVILTGALDDPLRSDEQASEGELAVRRPMRELVSSAGLTGRVAAFGLAEEGAGTRPLEPV